MLRFRSGIGLGNGPFDLGDQRFEIGRDRIGGGTRVTYARLGYISRSYANEEHKVCVLRLSPPPFLGFSPCVRSVLFIHTKLMILHFLIQSAAVCAAVRMI